MGIDVGGSGVKGGIVDLDTGQLIGERYKCSPQPAPRRRSRTVAEVVPALRLDRTTRRHLPGVVVRGVVQTAANVDKSWIRTDADDVISAAWAARG